MSTVIIKGIEVWGIHIPLVGKLLSVPSLPLPPLSIAIVSVPLSFNLQYAVGFGIMLDAKAPFPLLYKSTAFWAVADTPFQIHTSSITPLTFKLPDTYFPMSNERLIFAISKIEPV